jgi:hypothetical protein
MTLPDQASDFVLRYMRRRSCRFERCLETASVESWGARTRGVQLLGGVEARGHRTVAVVRGVSVNLVVATWLAPGTVCLHLPMLEPSNLGCRCCFHYCRDAYDYKTHAAHSGRARDEVVSIANAVLHGIPRMVGSSDWTSGAVDVVGSDTVDFLESTRVPDWNGSPREKTDVGQGEEDHGEEDHGVLAK